ncbi:MAG: tetratricopeptide repeat protein [Thermodesulfobacteriota bacterium]
MIDLSEENVPFREIADSFEKGQVDLPRLGENTPAQLLFSFQGARLSGLDDLSELVTSLDALPSNKRDQLLRVCNSDMDFATLLINRAWWKEVEDGVLDVNKALQTFDLTVMKSREWKVPELTKACLVAMSVIQDEYGNSAARALELLDEADEEFPDEASLVNQQAKVLFHANRDLEALPIANKALELPALGDVEFVFCCRVTGIAAAKSGDWADTERLFLLGAEKAKHTSVQKSMGIGLMADAAFALWKQKKYEKSLSLFADTLDSLGTITLSEDIRIRHLHATLRYSISWIHFEARGEHPTDFAEPPPGMCSNQEPHEGIKDHRIVDISAVWELLAITEHILELDVGIKERVQAATGGNKPLLVERYGRTIAFESIFKDRAFENLIPKLLGMLEALHHHKIFEEGAEEEWSMGEVPKLPDGYWGNPGNCDRVCHYMLVASVICTADNQAIPLPIERWRTDLANAGALPNDIDQFLNVLNGEHPDETLYQQSAAAIFELRSGSLDPADLWKGSFRLLNALMNEKRLVENALEGFLITHWLFATKNQRFAFTTPSLACPKIKRCCLDQSLSGVVKIAVVLDIAAPYLSIRLSTDVKQMIERIIEQI